MNAIDRLADHLERTTGIDMDRAGASRALERFLDRRIPELGLTSPAAYVDSLLGNQAELARLIDVVTVPHTWFFRDIEQWRGVECILERAALAHGVARAWVAGCATGEDAYTMALITRRRGIPIEITASDINQGVLGRAHRGIYNAWAVRDVPPEFRGHFRRRNEGHFEIDEELRKSVSFVSHNVVDAPLTTREVGWDLILCRNVFIYIARTHSGPTLRRLGQALRPGGSLVVGASDLVYALPPELSADYERGRFVLRRISPGARLREIPSGAEGPVGLPPGMSAKTPTGTRRIEAPRLALPKAVPATIPVARSSGNTRRPTSDCPVTSLVTLANQKFGEGDSSSAIVLYERAQAIDPLAAEPYFFAGVTHHSDGELDRAVHRLRSSLFLDPKFWPASLYLALCYDRMNRGEEALLEYRRVLTGAAEPFRFLAQTSLFDDLAHWRDEVVALARRRGGRPM